MEFKLVVHPEIGHNKTFTGNHRILITTRQTSVVIVLNDRAFEELVRVGNKYYAATAVAAKALQSCTLPIPEEELAELIVNECRKCAELYAGSPLRGYHGFAIMN